MRKYAVLLVVLLTLSVMSGTAAAGARGWGLVFSTEKAMAGYGGAQAAGARGWGLVFGSEVAE